MIHNKIHPIIPGCSRPSIALTLQNCGLKHQSFVQLLVIVIAILCHNASPLLLINKSIKQCFFNKNYFSAAYVCGVHHSDLHSTRHLCSILSFHTDSPRHVSGFAPIIAHFHVISCSVMLCLSYVLTGGM